MRTTIIRRHFHARHAGREAVIAIETHEVLAGGLAPRALALVMEWAALHVVELRADWDLARATLPLMKIAPLG